MFGVQPIFMDKPKTGGEFIRRVDRLVQDRSWADKGDAIVFVLGEPIGQVGLTNQLNIHYVGDAD